jgi:hypothetical protein
MATTSFELVGTDPMRKRIARLARVFGVSVENSLLEEAQRIMKTSQEEHVPVDKSVLKDSGEVSQDRRGEQVTVALSYETPYAVAVHEHLSDASPPSWLNTTVRFGPGNRGPKYLERPLMDAVPQLGQKLGARLKL